MTTEIDVGPSEVEVFFRQQTVRLRGAIELAVDMIEASLPDGSASTTSFSVASELKRVLEKSTCDINNQFGSSEEECWSEAPWETHLEAQMRAQIVSFIADLRHVPLFYEEGECATLEFEAGFTRDSNKPWDHPPMAREEGVYVNLRIKTSRTRNI